MLHEDFWEKIGNLCVESSGQLLMIMPLGKVGD
jgi:hypothetical protein